MTDYDDLSTRAAAAGSALWSRIQPLLQKSRDLELLAMCYAVLHAHPDIAKVEIGPSDQSNYSYLSGFIMADGTSIMADGTEVDSGGDSETEHVFADDYEENDVEQFVTVLEYDWLTEQGVSSGLDVAIDVQETIVSLAHLTAYLDPMPDPTNIAAVATWLDGIEKEITT